MDKPAPENPVSGPRMNRSRAERASLSRHFGLIIKLHRQTSCPAKAKGFFIQVAALANFMNGQTGRLQPPKEVRLNHSLWYQLTDTTVKPVQIIPLRVMVHHSIPRLNHGRAKQIHAVAAMLNSYAHCIKGTGHINPMRRPNQALAAER